MDARFDAMWRELGCASDPTSTREALLAAWSEPHRAYHDLDHLAACLTLLDEVLRKGHARTKHPAEIEAAIWFHDAIYDPRRQDNEDKSAEWARRALLDGGADPEVAERVALLVLATRHDAEPPPGDAALLVDIDLSILGAPPEAFDAYEEAVRREYAWVDDDAWRVGRKHVLETLLARSPIYATEALRARFEAQARANIERAVARL